MIIKNISGVTKYFSIGHRSGLGSRFSRGRELANGASATFGNDSKAVSDARELALAGEIEIVDGPAVAAEQGSVNKPAATQLLIAAAGPSNGDFVILNGVKFLYAAVTGTAVAPVIWAGAAAIAATAMNTLRTAVNAHATVGVKLGANLTIGADTVALITASAGANITVGANYAISKSGANITVAATLTNGAKGHVKEASVTTYTVTADDNTAGKWIIPTGLKSTPSNFIVQVNRAGAILPTLACTFVFEATTKGNLVVDDSGASTLAAADVITIWAHGA